MKSLLILISTITIGLIGINNLQTNPAQDFLNSLNEEQIESVLYPFDDIKRELWSFLPGSIMWRPGLKLDQLSKKQQSLLFKLLQESLSESGYNKALKIIDLENVLADRDKDTIFRDAKNYTVSFYGNPENNSLWAWSFEGHHLALKFTYTQQGVAFTPRFMGADPATIDWGPRKGERTLAKEEDYGLQLIHSMTTDQKQKTIFKKQTYFDILTSNAVEVSPLKSVGIKMKDLNQIQKSILENLILEYLSAIPNDIATLRMKKLKQEDYDEIRFGWAGATENGKGHYYRIQGKSFLIEFDNLFGNHIHTVWRDFEGDFGRDLIKEHYQKLNHHKN